MDESADQILKEIQSLAAGQAPSISPIHTRLRIGELKKRYASKTGDLLISNIPNINKPPSPFGRFGQGSIQITSIPSPVDFDFGIKESTPLVEFPGSIDLSSGHVTGMIQDDEEVTSRMLSDAIARAGGDAELVRKVNGLEDLFSDADSLTTSAKGSGNGIGDSNLSGGSKHPYPSNIAQILAFDQDGNLVSSGVGFLIAPRLVLTCFHVVADAKSVQFRFSSQKYNRLKNFTGDISFSHTLSAKALNRGGSPDLWIQSSPFKTSSDYLAGNFDLALLEIDPQTERLGVSIEAERDFMEGIPLVWILAAVGDVSNPLRPCPLAANNPNQGQNIELLRPDYDIGVRKSSGSTRLHDAIPIHTVPDTSVGDSGSPLVIQECGLAGMHTSAALLDEEARVGRFVHVDKIRETLNSSSALKSSNHGLNLGSNGWISVI